VREDTGTESGYQFQKGSTSRFKFKGDKKKRGGARTPLTGTGPPFHRQGPGVGGGPRKKRRSGGNCAIEKVY